MGKRNDLATFPELFGGGEQFINEQLSGLKRTCALFGLALAVAGGLFLLHIFQNLG